jgi:hypothetical protein
MTNTEERILQDWSAANFAGEYTNVGTLLDALDAIGRMDIMVGEAVASIARTAAASLLDLSMGDEEMSVDFK